MHPKIRQGKDSPLGPFYWFFHVIVELVNDPGPSDQLRMASSNCFFFWVVTMARA